MARTYANFLLFEDVLDNLPDDAAPIMKQAVDLLLSPIVKVVEEDCGTLLGRVVDASFEHEGLTYLPTGEKLSQDSITTLLTNGVYKFKIRDLSTCNSHLKGGICRKCYEASRLGEIAPPVGTIMSLPTSQIYQTDRLLGTGFTTKFPLSQTEDDWYDIAVIYQGHTVDSSLYTLGFDYIEFTNVLPLNKEYIVHFLQETTSPFQGYISKTYSGGLLGMNPLPTIDIMLRPSLYESMFPDSFLGLMIEEISYIRIIPPTYVGYIDRIHDRIEKVLYVLYLYALYKNIEA